jgi:hypothetical protein
MHDMLHDRIDGKFYPSTPLCRAFLAQIKSHPMLEKPHPRVDYHSELIDDMLYYAQEAEAEQGMLNVEALDELCRNIVSTDWKWHSELLRSLRQSFIGVMIARNLKLYVQHKLDVGGLRSAPELMKWALSRPPKVKHDVQFQSDMVQLILECFGSSALPSIPVWVEYLRRVAKNYQQKSGLSRHHLCALEMLLDAEMDVNVCFDAQPIWVKIITDNTGFIIKDMESYALVHDLPKLFLSRGADPNHASGNTTAWGSMLLHILRTNKKQDDVQKLDPKLTKMLTEDRQNINVRFVEDCLAHGADPQWRWRAEIEGFTNAKNLSCSALDIVREIVPPDQVDRLEALYFTPQNCPSGWFGWMSGWRKPFQYYFAAT